MQKMNRIFLLTQLVVAAQRPILQYVFLSEDSTYFLLLDFTF